MKTRKNKHNIFWMFATMIFVFATSGQASADSWWGKGYRDADWVLKHGGTIIKYEITNISGDDNEYKAVMYDDDGDYVEKEFGTKAKFDDAKDDKYEIRAYRVEGGIIDKTTHKGGKKFASIKVVAHPGETIKLKIDYKKEKIKMTTDYIVPVAKPAVNPTPKLAPVLDSEIQSEPEKIAPETLPVKEEEIVGNQENNEFFLETMEDFFHPDAYASEFEKKIYLLQKEAPMPENIKEEESANIFIKYWNAIAEFFSSGDFLGHFRM